MTQVMFTGRQRGVRKRESAVNDEKGRSKGVRKVLEEKRSRCFKDSEYRELDKGELACTE